MKRGKLLKTTFVTLMVCATAGTLFACGGDKEYKVVYLGGEGATGDAPAEATYKEGDKFNLATNTFTKANHTFKGWSDGTSTYLEGVEYTMGTADVTFTALWEENSAPITYTVTYALGDHAASDATVPSAVGDLLANAQVTLPAAPKAAEGYEFTGWKVGSDSTLKKAGDKITVTANVTVTAQWKAKEVTPPVDDKYATDAEIKDGILNWYTPNSKNYFVADGEEVTVQATYKLTEVQAWFGILTDIGFNGNFYRFRPDCQVFFLDTGTPPNTTPHNTWTEDPALYNLEIDRTNWDEAKYKALFDNDGSAIQVIHITLKDKVLTVTLSYYAGTDTELKTPVAVAAYKATTESDTAEIQPYFYTDHAVVSSASAKYAKASNTFVNLTFDFDTEGVENAVVPMRPGKADYVFGVDPTKAGYTFGGWKSSDESDTTLYKNTDTVPVTVAVTYTAQWTVAKYTVTYVLGGNAAETATAPEAVSDKLYGDKINLPEAPAAAAGYEFDGWKVGDATELKAAGAEIEITGDVTITAIFKGKEEYTATYKPGDHAAEGEVDRMTTVFYDDAEITLPNAPDAAMGYEFAGWKVGDATELKQNGDKITLTADTDIVAQWKAIKYTVTFNVGEHAEEGATVAAMKADYNTEITLPAGPTAATGYSFTGWKVGTSDTVKQAGDEILVTADTTLTATWVSTENSWTVTFLANEGDQTAHSTQTVAKDATGAAKKLVLPTTNAPTKDGYRLLGWYLSTDTEKTVLTNETLPDVTANMTVIAKWQAVFTVTVLDDLEGDAVNGAKTSYDNNGTGGTAEKFVAPTGVKKTGYTLAGWFEVVDNEGTKAYGSEVTATTDITKSMTVAAKWNEIKYTVTYALGEHAATAATAPEAVEVTHNVGKVTLPAAPAAETNYAFKGWKVGDATELSAAGAEIDVTADVTITAEFGLSIVIGAADFNKPWSGVNPEWTDTITPGTRITLTGTLTSRATANWNSLTTNLFKGDEQKVFMRSDNFVAYEGNAEQTQTADGDFYLAGRSTHGVLRATAQDAEAGWTIFRGILATEGGCNVKVVFDWKEADTITITVIHSNNATYHTQVYSWVAAAGKTLADSYQIGIGNDNCYAVFDFYEKINYATDKVTTAFEEPNKNLYEGATGLQTALVQGGNLQLGQEIVISGKQTSAVADNYHSLYFEFRNDNGCYTGRSDSYGWTWTAEGKVCPFRDTQAARYYYIQKADGTYSLDWADFKDVAKDCIYIISASWINQGEIEVKLVMNGANGNQFVCYYQLEVTDPSLQQISFTIGAETVTNFTAESKEVYTHITSTPAD